MATPASAQEVEQLSTIAKPRRVLACVLCQQRKVKCDRKFPCAYCVRAGVQCVPGNTVVSRQRRRRFPERELLERLRHYESLLRQNNINFGPLHPTESEVASPGEQSKDSPEKDHSEIPGMRRDVKSKEAVDLWHAISRATMKTLGPEDEDEDDDGDDDGEDDGDGPTSATPSSQDHERRRYSANFKRAWTHRFKGDGHHQFHDGLLFCPPLANFEVSALHPGQAQIFRLWQIYLDRVNPLLKVTHTPTLQSRIIDAVSDIVQTSPALEALIFSIYCISVASLTENECRALFHSSRQDLLATYHATCQQALFKCGAWRSDDMDSLTALYLYLVSVRSETHPRSLSCMLAVAIRIAQRMGMHSESTYAGLPALEAEMRRRLWWSLVTFDHRMSEMSDYKTSMLGPTWDCDVPRNVNDFELRPDMKTPPTAHEKPTEALFAIVRSDLANFIRHSAFHLSFVNPSLNVSPQTKDAEHSATSGADELTNLERMIENRHISSCDAENPLHYMTMWTVRGAFARNRLMEHYAKHSASSVRPSGAQRSTAISYALSMLECDTKLRTSSLTQGYVWYVNFYYPALAYLHILNNLRKRPDEDHAEKAWNAMSDNYEALDPYPAQGESDKEKGMYRFFVSFAPNILQAWEAREISVRQQHKPPEPVPGFVLFVRNKVMQTSSDFFWQDSSGGNQLSSNVVDPNNAENVPISIDPMIPNPIHGVGARQGLPHSGIADMFPGVLGQAAMDVDTDQFWTEINWI